MSCKQRAREEGLSMKTNGMKQTTGEDFELQAESSRQEKSSRRGFKYEQQWLEVEEVGG